MEYGIGDMVRVRETDEVLEVLEVGTYTYRLSDGQDYSGYELDWAK